MYIAFKWLLGLTLAMWIAMCCFDSFLKRNIILMKEGYHIQTSLEFGVIENKTVPLKTNRFTRITDKENNVVYLHYFMFIAGILVMLLYNQVNDLMINVPYLLAKIFTRANAQSLQHFSKVTAFEVANISTMVFIRTWVTVKNFVYNLKNALRNKFKLRMFYKPKINPLLLKKLKEIEEERKYLAQLLIAAINENKNIRMQFQLENMAKKRLVRYMENTQKIIKENRSSYVSFQQLYLVTHQENTFLKTRIKKLTQEKADTQKNLLELINEIYKTKNNELKAYCSRFIVKTKDNLLNSDVTGEIKRFLRKPLRKSLDTPSNCQLTERPEIAVINANSWLQCSNCMEIAEIFEDGTSKPLINEAPKLKGLPGEYVWTVKDKDGVIEKLYEYDGESDLDNGETIRRIRQYSVYYDKDCLLDFSNSSTVINECANTQFWAASPRNSLDCSLTRQRFLTGSEAFKNFMQNNKNVVSTSILPAKPN